MPSVPPPAAPSQSASQGLQPPTEADAAGRGPDEPPWPIWTAPAAIVLGFALGIFVTIFVDIGAQAGGSSLTNPTPAVALIGDVLFDAGFVAAAVYFGLRFRAQPADYGYRRVALGLAFGSVVVAALSYYVLSAAYASIFKLTGEEKLPLPLSKNTGALVGATVFVCVIAPIAEEFFFRGFIFGALRRWRIQIAGREIGTWVAAIVTGILFGLAHTGSASPRYLVPLGLLGFVLCLVRWRTRSLYPCMALHSLNNSLALGIDQFHWNVGEICALIAGSVLMICALTLPLANRTLAVRRAA